MLDPRTVVSGGDSGFVALHRLGQPDAVNGEPQEREEGGAAPPALRLEGLFAPSHATSPRLPAR